jgi:triacylglycerol lipase
MNLHLAISLARQIAALYAHDAAPNVVDRHTDTQVLVEQLPDGRWAIVFPGTASLRDAWTDVKIRKERWTINGGRVHRGFANAYRGVWDAISHRLPFNSRLIIAGHSLGGALATLAADTLNGPHHVEGVYTFGSPRVGNATFARNYNKDLRNVSYRFVNAGDPVPHLPWVFATYRHVDQIVYLDRSGALVVDAALQAAISEWRATLETVANPPANLALAEPHAMTSYLAKLEALL